ncbi:MAG: response regulator [Clostridiales bacterium]|nr:response regulator [Clostridiales bacterium]
MRDKKKLILVVDDVEVNRSILSNLFCDDFEVLEAVDGLEAIKLIKQHGRDLSIALLDIVMPQVDGFGVLQYMCRTGLISVVPVILITGEDDDQKTLLGYGLGVSDFIIKPFNTEIVFRRIMNVVDLYTHKNNLERMLEAQKDVLERQAQRLSDSNLFLIDALSTTVEFRNLESGQHIKRMRMLTKLLLQNMRHHYPLSDEEINVISMASSMHDIGKIAIPDAVLLKPGPLTQAEYEIMKTHTIRGCEILDSFSSIQDRDYYTYCYEICRHHHERWNGCGYPDGLKGDEISIWAQAASLADVYDALTSVRVYKQAYTHKKAVEMIVGGECGVFNPKLLNCFILLESALQEQFGQESCPEPGEAAAAGGEMAAQMTLS